jgi:prepilin-type N-terminal cleavage/methylation domain-containing protein
MKLPSRQPNAFTLVEILTVLSIMAIITAIAVPAMMGSTASGRMNQNLLELTGVLEQSREYALSQNTYVWVAFAPGTDGSGVNTLSVALLASKDGTDPASPASWANTSYGSVPNIQIGLISKIITLRQFTLVPAATFSTTQIPSLPPAPGPINGLASSSGFFSLQMPGTATSLTFNKALQFCPTGEARNGTSPVDLLELDLEPQKGNAYDQKNVAVIRVNGLTGESIVYRP